MTVVVCHCPLLHAVLDIVVAAWVVLPMQPVASIDDEFAAADELLTVADIRQQHAVNCVARSLASVTRLVQACDRSILMSSVQ
jgi:hypothetical protein